MERLRELLNTRLERLQDMLSGLSPRDRKLLLGMVAFLLVAVVGGGAYALNRALHAQRDRLDERQSQLMQLEAMLAEHGANAAQIGAIEDRIRAHADTDLQAFVEQAGKEVGISDRITGVREKPGTTTGDLEDRLYTVTLTRLTLDEYSNFLFEVEGAGYPLKVRTTKIKRRARGEEITLDVDMDISAFRLVEAEAAGTEG